MVASRQSDFGVRLIADSSINSNSKDPTSAQPEAQVSLSFGIGVGNYAHDSTAFIGSGPRSASVRRRSQVSNIVVARLSRWSRSGADLAKRVHSTICRCPTAR